MDSEHGARLISTVELIAETSAEILRLRDSPAKRSTGRKSGCRAAKRLCISPQVRGRRFEFISARRSLAQPPAPRDVSPF